MPKYQITFGVEMVYFSIGVFCAEQDRDFFAVKYYFKWLWVGL
jgi:hypothetical protein